MDDSMNEDHSPQAKKYKDFSWDDDEMEIDDVCANVDITAESEIEIDHTEASTQCEEDETDIAPYSESSDETIKTKSSVKVQKEKERVTFGTNKLHWKWNLRVLISNLYMESERRLPGASVPRCLHNTSQCVSQHRCAMLPDAPNFMSAQALRNTLHGQHYDTFLDIVERMILQGVYPGEGVPDRLIDMAMILTTKGMTIEELGGVYNKVIRTFYLYVDAFPPCWTALRPYYLNFLGVPNPATIREKSSDSSQQKLEFYLNLLEEIIPECSDQELGELTKFYQKHVYDFSEEENANMSQETAFLRHVQEYDWLSGKLCLDDFKTLNASVRLARVFDVLNLLTWVLEMEFLSWLDHNRLRQSSPEIFQEDTKPFAALVFDMESTMQLSDLMRQVMRLYGQCVNKSLYKERLNILQRLLSLIMEISNTSEIKYEQNAAIYPNLGPMTKRLIGDFFKIFKTKNPSHISKYLKTIRQLDQPYVRFEFTDNFLSLFYYTKGVPFGPEKVCEEFKSRQWLRYKSRTIISKDNDDDEDEDEQLSREDYLEILLNALKDYCEWLNLASFWKYLKTKEQVPQLQAKTASALSTPVGIVTGDVGKMFMLDEMEKEVHTWKRRMNTKTLMGKPKVNLPVARINVGIMCVRYGDDVRQLRYLRRLLEIEVAGQIDVTDWLIYLNDFLGEDTEPEANSAKQTNSTESSCETNTSDSD
ncbi:uncharacterized protein [Drosophila tropicalis]|uniref:uncharacterized protein n=1 Tax=Drosophila tropicalis TaxID=46794 RepID=UPI0035AB75BE